MGKLEKVNEEHHQRYNDMMQEWKTSSIDSVPKILRVQDSYVAFDDIYRIIDKNIQGVKSEVFFLIGEARLLGILQLRIGIEGTIYETRGGNIAYGIRPTERQKGYATEILALGLQEMRKRDYSKVLLTCASINTPSQKVIVKNGGILEAEIQDANGEMFRRYWITL